MSDSSIRFAPLNSKFKIPEADLEPRALNGESILVSLKVPVEEVFLGSSEPVVAFRDDNYDEWKKGVFTTHTQFDQSQLPFVVSL